MNTSRKFLKIHNNIDTVDAHRVGMIENVFNNIIAVVSVLKVDLHFISIRTAYFSLKHMTELFVHISYKIYTLIH